MGNFKLGPATTFIGSYITLNPEYDYAFPEIKDQVDHRSLSGVLFSYKFNIIKKFEIPESFVNSSNRSLVNSWWSDNTELALFEDFPDIGSGWKVRIINKEEPYPQFERPYFLTQHKGTLMLETIDETTVSEIGIFFGSNTPWCGATDDKLYLQSGQFTSTLKTSEDVSGVEGIPQGMSYNGIDTFWCGSSGAKLYLQSGQFTSTLRTSEDISGIDGIPLGISYDGTNTPWSGNDGDKLYLQSGHFTSTLKTSEDVSGIDTSIRGICTNRFDLRLGI
jgi:hypothetical protein